MSADTGMAPGRKVKSFLWMVVSVLACVITTTKIHTPDPVTIQALWIIGMGGLFTVGGQSFVDSIEKWVAPRSGVSSESITKVTSTQSKEEKQ